MSRMMNLGCGPDVKEGWDWVNVDIYREGLHKSVLIWDAREPAFTFWNDTFDFVLINHVLCTMSYDNVDKVLVNVKDILKPEGVIQVIDMNILKAYEAYATNNILNIPIGEGDKDFKLAMHISGYSTRLSIYTPNFMSSSLKKHGYKDVKILTRSQYDSRPNESLIVEGTR